MKKLLVSLLVLAFCASAVADVAITATDEGGGHLKIKVAPTGGASVRGIALKLSNANGAVIDATTDVTSTQFNTFIDYAYDNAGYAIGTGHAIADAAGAGVATLPASTFVLSAGYLDQGGNQAGVTVDSFFDITYTITVPSTIAIALDSLRGGIVGDTLGNVTVQASQLLALTGETVSTPNTPALFFGGKFYGKDNGPGSATTVQQLPVVTGGSTSSLSNPVEYRFNWGDGNTSLWGAAEQLKGYATEGATYTITAQARTTNTLVESAWSAGFTHTVGTECQKYNLTKRINSATDNSLSASDLGILVSYINANRSNSNLFSTSTSHANYDERYNFDATASLSSGDLGVLVTYVNAARSNSNLFSRACAP